jgi:hypothetical protein
MGRMWMVRRRDHSLSRPMPESVLVEKIEKGEFNRQDEICISAGYWFSLGDAVEVRKFLGNVRLDGLGGRNPDFETVTHTDVGISQVGTPEKTPDRKAFEPRISGESSFQNQTAGNPLFMILLTVIFLYTLFLIWKNSG